MKDSGPSADELQLLHITQAGQRGIAARFCMHSGLERTAAVLARLAAHEAFLAFPYLRTEA